MEKTAKIYVAGHHGLVGSAIWNNLQQKGYTNLVGRSHKELDLLDGQAVKKFFDEEQPQYVILAAAHVGGIMANSLYRADFIYQNLQIQQNVIGESFRHDVKKLLFLGSTCIYPRDAVQPMKEDVLLTSPLEYTTFSEWRESPHPYANRLSPLRDEDSYLYAPRPSPLHSGIFPNESYESWQAAHGCSPNGNYHWDRKGS